MKKITLNKPGAQFERDFEYKGKLVIKERQPRIIDFLKRKKIVKWWIGTDALSLEIYPPGRLSWYIRIFFRRLWYRLIHKHIEHWVVSERLADHLNWFGIYDIKLVIDPPCYDKVEKIKHEGVNILFYYPKHKKKKRLYNRWVYGIDIFERLLETVIRGVHWYIVDGSQNLKEIYPIIDGYIRPSRHDGMPRMLIECDRNNIPYCTSTRIDNQVEFIESLCNNNSI